MRRGIAQSLREFWDAGIRGPDFVWAATGPALFLGDFARTGGIFSGVG